MMKLNKIAAIALCTGTALVLASGSLMAAEKWRGWNIHPEGYPNSIALEQFAKDVTDKTEGRVEASVYHGAILGAQSDAIEQTRNGALDFANFSMGPMGPIIPETNVLSLPFLFTGEDQMHKAMDGAPGKKFSEAMEKKGLVALSWFDSGSRSFYNNTRPITKPSDLDGMKIRVMNNQLYVDMVNAMGGNATPMAYGEVYQSLKTGVLDGAENNYPSFESSNHFETAKYYSTTQHLIIPECLCIAVASWNKLSDADKEAVSQAAKDASTKQRELWAARSIASREKVEKAGITVNVVSDKSAFQEKMKPVYAKFIEKNPTLETLITDIQNTK